MPTLPTKSFTTVVADIATGVQGRASALINFAIGSTLRAIAEGYAAVFMWFQAMVLQLLMAIRLSTSTGTDVDTFTADFMPVLPGTTSPRLGAQAASGQVTLSRFTAGSNSIFIPVGTLVATTVGSQLYRVVDDPTYATYSVNPTTGNGYTMPAAVADIVVPVVNIVPGSAGNALAGQIDTLRSSIGGIDTVNNDANFTNGSDVESDDALKKRFSDYILGLSRGDIYGLTASVEGVDTEVQWSLMEEYNYDGSWRPGYFFIVVDDGSGNPPPNFVQSMTDAANAVRPLGMQCGVFPPVIIWATPSLQITTAPFYDHNTVVAAVAAAVATNINSLGLGNDLPWTMLAAWAYAVPGVTAVANVLLNGFTGDAASISASRMTFDGYNEIDYATIKCQSVIVS